MSQHPGYSPSFKLPAEIMRMRRKRARSSTGSGSAGSPGQSDLSPASVRTFSPGPLFHSQTQPGCGIKRRNPFANIDNTYSPKKKLIIYNDAGNAEAAEVRKPSEEEEEADTERREARGERAFREKLMQAERREHQDSSKIPFSEDDSLFEEEEEDVKSPIMKSPRAVAPASIAPPVCIEYPSDWSLKTRLLFTSPLPMSWAEHPRAQEEALGLSQHCRSQFSSLPHSIQDPKSCSELRCSFQQSLAYWQHPSFPWIPLFPRINAERSFARKSAPWAQDASLQQSLMSEWSVSLSSLYSLLKARLCPYFYLCSYQFTVLFRAAGLGGSGSISALISPTTRGLRDAMKAEDIEFSCPLVEEKRKSREHKGAEQEKSQECREPTEDDDDRGDEGDDNDDEDSGFSWLKEMGVQDQIKTPDRIILRMRKGGHAVSLDHKPESVVHVEGSHTFTLINFLINCKGLVAAAGSQAGLPPTLLAPVAFRGAAMHTLKAHSVNVKSRVGCAYQNISSLEVTGPVLPSALHAITTLLKTAQKGNFSATLYTHTPTAVMNTHVAEEQGSGGSADLSSCGIHPASIQQLQQPSSLGKTALTHISMTDYSYTWKN
ncbi:protein downstream neighbor of son homolog isoform X2 [Antennarius striatus]|uniref:protein downstream neighbor of son homolog isoform X2 n=1 Tax=Antennarius striatus TaxID=241820 RepID=UPI0035B0A4B2